MLFYTNTEYDEYMTYGPYVLSVFQKWAIEAIVTGNDVLICAHTGSGKTLPAEYAIKYYNHYSPSPELSKKIIYCSPIKALSNQKYYDFKTNPLLSGIDIGLITGDIKMNINANVLIMTTEILLNKLLKTYGGEHFPKASNIGQEGINIADICCVIFDEVHYINDKDRGNVWEQAIMLLPKSIQIIMLSATLENPELFAEWCEKRISPEKQVYLTNTQTRIVPLVHYSFITCGADIYKLYGKSKAIEQEINAVVNDLHIIKAANGQIYENNMDKVRKILTMFDKKNYAPSRKHVLNKAADFLVKNEMLPALCFVYSRRNVEKMALEIETVLLEDDSKVPYIVAEECTAMLRRSFTNWREYVELNEYKMIVKLLEKGVGIHHAGLINVFREMIEILFSKGYIKILFATETFSVGINMPTKTVLFTELSKWDGASQRMLLPHEYIQQAGRAGRRGKDTIGHVIHLSNLWQSDKYTNADLVQILRGTPQTLESKLIISYGLVLNILCSATTSTSMTKCTLYDMENFLLNSLYNNKILRQNVATLDEISHLTHEIEVSKEFAEVFKNLDKLAAYKKYERKFSTSTNKQKKQIKAEMDALSVSLKDYQNYNEYLKILEEINKKEMLILENKKCIKNQLNIIISILDKYEFIKCCLGDDMIVTYELTYKGRLASFIKEINNILFIEWFYGSPHAMTTWSEIDIVMFLSIFAGVGASNNIDGMSSIQSATSVAIDEEHAVVYTAINDYSDIKNTLIEYELLNNIETEIRVALSSTVEQYDLIIAIKNWYNAETEVECKKIMECDLNGQISVGEFVKVILKINSILMELSNLAEYMADYDLKKKIDNIYPHILKYICTSQSIYL